MSNNQCSEQVQLNRSLGGFMVQLISLGGIIGSCYYLGIGYSIAQQGPAIMISILAVGILVAIVSVCLGCVAVNNRDVQGSFVSHTKMFCGAPWAAAVGWSYWTNWVFYIPSEAIAASIVVHAIIPAIPPLPVAIMVVALITYIQLSKVEDYGKFASVLAIFNIAAILLFITMGVLIWLGLIGHEGYLGTKVLTLGSGELTVEKLAPAGVLMIFTSMIMTLVNFQGVEIVGLTAAESANPEKDIPKAAKSVAIRVVGIFLAPVAVVLLILKYTDAGMNGSVFAQALSNYGFGWAGLLFNLVVLCAAVGCATSGAFGSTRVLYGLACEGLAPKFLGKLNKNAVPMNATLLTVGLVWALIPMYIFIQGSSIYVFLLATAGFCGSVCWIFICINCYKYITIAQKKGETILAPVNKYLALFVAAVLAVFLLIVPFNKDLNPCLVIGFPSVVIPFVIVYVMERKKQRNGAQQINEKTAA